MARRSSSSRSPAPLFRMLEGGQRLDPERVAAHQRSRLQGAMVEAVARHGYQDVTVAELVALAGVSKATLYKHFTDKQGCFLSTFDTIAGISAVRVRAAHQEAKGEGFEERMRAAFEAFFEVVIANQAAASMMLIDSIALGEAALGARERLTSTYEHMFRESFRAGPAPVDAATIRGIVGGIQRVTYRRLRDGEPERLRDDIDGLLAWSISYVRDREAPAAERDRGPAAAVEGGDPTPTIDWEEPLNSPVSRAQLNHRERIVRAVAVVVAEDGYRALTIPRISATAGISNQTFYECFPSKEEAFLSAFRDLADLALQATAGAFAGAPDWEHGIRAGLEALLAFVASNQPFARLAFIELPVAGRAAIGTVDGQVEMFTTLLLAPILPEDRRTDASPLIADAIGGAVWTLIQHEVVRGRLRRLPRLAPALERMALQPYQPAAEPG